MRQSIHKAITNRNNPKLISTRLILDGCKPKTYDLDPILYELNQSKILSINKLKF